MEKVVTQLLRGGVQGEQIGVITPYEGQRAHVLSVLAKLGPLGATAYSSVEVSSVDAFQGREKDFIILSCVRSNEHQVRAAGGVPPRAHTTASRVPCKQACLLRPLQPEVSQLDLAQALVGSQGPVFGQG